LRPSHGERGLRRRRFGLPRRRVSERPRLTRVAVIADTHSRPLPDACVDELRRADLILHVGDLSTVAVLDELRSYAPVEAVFGNNDEPALVRTLPETAVVQVDDVRIGLVHDGGRRAGREARLLARLPGCDAIVYGHSHLPQLERAAGVWILNPGSPTQRRRAPARSLIVLEIAGKTLRPRLVELT
jgi:uncharacterized protein